MPEPERTELSIINRSMINRSIINRPMIKRSMIKRSMINSNNLQCRTYSGIVSLCPVKPDNGDAEFLCGLMNNGEVMKALNEMPSSLKNWLSVIDMWHKDIDERDYIIYLDGSRVGWLGINGMLSPSQRPYIKMLAVLPEYQGRGIGCAALEQAIGILKSKGYLSIDLHTNIDNIAAQKCYIKCGFKIIGVITQKMSDGTLAERYTMRRKL